MQANDLRKQITAQIIEALESGHLPPWRKPWNNDPAAGFPTNALTHRNYRGINPLLLDLSGMNHGFQSRFWATFRQWKELGGWVRRGSRGTKIIFYRPLEKTTTNDEGEEETDAIYLMRSFVVFNAEQVDGTNLEQFRVGTMPATPALPDTRFDDADEVVAATNARICFGGNRAFYVPASDYIQVPLREQFKTDGQFYETLFHELVHWTEPRRKWEGSYELGELIAEIGSCYLSAELRIPHGENLDNHAAYLQGWLSAMKADPNFIFRAGSQSSKAADFLLAFKASAQTEATVAE
jgi:antirestriction protein ArdC